MKMENSEEIFLFLEEFSKRKPKTIPQELNEYLAYVARTGDPVYQWPLVKSLFKEKLLNVITDFYETSPGIDIPPYPNVDPFNYDTMKNSLLERLDSFTSAPFTVQRICELLTYPRKQYNRVDKFMRAIEKNILVVSTREPGSQRHIEPENGEAIEPVVNGSDNNSEYNVDVEMEDMAWKENAEQQKQQEPEPQPGSSDSHISVHEIEERLMAKKEAQMDGQEKVNTQYESVTPPELNVGHDTPIEEVKNTSSVSDNQSPSLTNESSSNVVTDVQEAAQTSEKADIEMKTADELSPPTGLIIPEIQLNNVEMTEQELNEQTDSVEIKISELKEKPVEEMSAEIKANDDVVAPLSIDENSSATIDESSSDSSKEELEPKLISEVSTSSEESSSSSDITDGNSNSPKTEETPIGAQEESNQSDNPAEPANSETSETTPSVEDSKEISPKVMTQTDNYSISDVNSELPQPPQDVKDKDIPPETLTEIKEPVKEEIVTDTKEEKAEITDTDNVTST
ncbi:serine/threonine-protein phosphatase 4 regulatory subunit 2 [Plodia interpunctella]|uniref:serine/threonine-protein phosphatase 4 regulatory subunit 2 n=1 Tax=Plodia interpunctella TaxID=58824 RepID=UPI00236782D6|nr:serine/threonine-protein phosphatase 4 regulatory subunit 2 [Plodia interpunctella]